MLQMKKWMLILLWPLLVMMTHGVWAAPGYANYLFEMPKIDHTDQDSLQRGAKYYMNYCSGCHSLQYMRYERMAKDIGMTDEHGEVMASVVKANLMFTSDRIGDQILVAVPPEESRRWFGVTPPDLSLVSPYRSEKWLYNYLLSFYVDKHKAWGVNNSLFPDVAMPNVLLNLQGEQQPIYKTTYTELNGQKIEHKTITGFELTKPGEMSPQEFQMMVYDLVNFMSYVGDPVKVEREHMGVLVILFLLFLLVFAYLLKREYWKDVK
jgi:ubiquinol-cytochrome c reductase cytochrome c1 subunit